jgi:hypothetical protein
MRWRPVLVLVLVAAAGGGPGRDSGGGGGRIGWDAGRIGGVGRIGGGDGGTDTLAGPALPIPGTRTGSITADLLTTNFDGESMDSRSRP